VANDNDNQSVLSHIDRLVKEEEHLYGKSELTEEDRRRLADLPATVNGSPLTRKSISSFDLPWLHQTQTIQRWLS
jgi:hypothetical protein